jgi:enoyl-CoA hydratase/carnithine racemase
MGVLFDVAGSVATVTINRPERHNAMSFSILGALREAVQRAAGDPSVAVIVLTGAGERALCSGADLGGINGDDADALDAHRGRGELAGLFGDLWGCGKPTVARVHGYALAGGFGLALACDIVFAADDAVFGTPEVNIGLWPYMITVPMLNSMPAKYALELMLTGRRVTAAEAERVGFVNRVLPAAELDEFTSAYAAELGTKSPQAIALGRSAFYDVLGMSAEQALRQLHAVLTVATSTADAREGVRAFAEKRPAQWVRREASDGR